MNATLILCRKCAQVLGCTDPEEKSCQACQTHDCPFLPAPQQAQGLCDRCVLATRGRHWEATGEPGHSAVEHP